jgi:hypothetical protein
MKRTRTPIRGIVVAGSSLDEVQNLYRAVATGQNVQAFSDSDDTFIVLSSTESNIDMLNPLTGSDDLIAGDGLTEQMEFLSSASNETVDTNYTICTAGCGVHILADDADLMQHCPACASSLEMLDEDQIESLSADEDGEGCEGCQESAMASGATFEEAVASYRNLINGDVDATHIQVDSDVIIAVAGAAEYNVYSGDVADVVEDYQPQILEAIASTSDNIEAHHFICSSSSCTAPHVICSDEMPVFCPSCASGLLEPEDLDYEESLSSSDEDDEDDIDEDDVDMDEDMDDEDYEESLSSSEDDLDEDDLDEDDLDEDDLDEDDLDEDDLDEDEEDEDEEDEESDDGMTLSVSSVRTVRRGRNRSLSSSTPQEFDAVDVSMVATASSKGNLEAAKLDAVYVGSVQGDNTWFAMYDGLPIAKACASTTKHTEIFNGEIFGRAFKAQACEHGVEAALSNMGFEDIQTQLNVPSYVQSEIESQVVEREAAMAASFQQDRDELHDRFSAAMALAATGISKGFFKGKQNPIQQSLITSLSAVGINNASALVAQAFAANSEEYHKLLLAQASNILSYNLETQNQLAEAILDSNDVREESIASSAPVTLGRPVQVESEVQTATASVTSNQSSKDFNSLMQQALQGLGNRR